jgi:hypothetical protein
MSVSLHSHTLLFFSSKTKQPAHLSSVTQPRSALPPHVPMGSSASHKPTLTPTCENHHPNIPPHPNFQQIPLTNGHSRRRSPTNHMPWTQNMVCPQRARVTPLKTGLRGRSHLRISSTISISLSLSPLSSLLSFSLICLHCEIVGIGDLHEKRRTEESSDPTGNCN